MASSLSTMLLSLISLLLLNRSYVVSDSSFVTNTCSTTKYADTCIATFNSDPRSAAATTTTELSRIGIQLSASMADETHVVLSALLNNASNYDEWARRSACYWVYNATAYDVGVVGLKRFDEKNYGGAYESVGALWTSADECNKQHVDAVSERNKIALGFSEALRTIIRSLF